MRHLVCQPAGQRSASRQFAVAVAGQQLTLSTLNPGNRKASRLGHTLCSLGWLAEAARSAGSILCTWSGRKRPPAATSTVPARMTCWFHDTPSLLSAMMRLKEIQGPGKTHLVGTQKTRLSLWSEQRGI